MFPKKGTLFPNAQKSKTRQRLGADIGYCGYASVDSVDTALRRACDDLEMPRLGVYSVRHWVTSVLRAAKVPAEQISYQLGHRRHDLRTTRNYGLYDPSYLSEAATALEAWIKRVSKLASLNSHGIPTKRAAGGKQAA